MPTIKLYEVEEYLENVSVMTGKSHVNTKKEVKFNPQIMHSSATLGDHNEEEGESKGGVPYAEKALHKMLKKHKRDLKVYEDMLLDLEK